MERPEQFSIYAPSATPDAKSSSSNGAVIGGAIGGGLGAALIIGILIFFFCRRRKRTRRVSHPEVGATASTPMMKDEFQDRHSAQYVQSRKFTLQASYNRLLTSFKLRLHTLHQTQTTTRPYLQLRATCTNSTAKKLLPLRNYRQISHHLLETDTRSFQQKHHPAKLTESPRCQPVQIN
jgi:hypothetical protein